MRFYVYELRRTSDDSACYIGKGTGRRMWNHRRYAVRPPAGTQSYLYRKLSELLACGDNFYPVKVFETDSELEALAAEKRFIELRGLANLFNSGLNHPGTQLKDIHEARRVAMSRARREHVAKLQAEHGYKMPPDVRARISASGKGIKKNGAAISRSKKGVPLTEAHKAALRGVKKTYTPEGRAARNAAAGRSIKVAWDSGRLTGSRGKRIHFKNPALRAARISATKRGAAL